ncbi:S4 domain-containing protein YaaA [Streptococcus didelphis]|uniref:S4 domain-containing protein YaaA n=1 Tax=Streptococcus didelphis TaxID=102886 RepID=UPI00036FF5D7|nr:S4 domain-containing protein YaaA [Streptococcus didelphis]
MEYKLFTEFITLQALLKELSIIQSGGAVKSFLEDTEVLFNGQEEKRRGKKIRVGDVLSIPSKEIEIKIVKPSEEEQVIFAEELTEKKRVASLVKQMNQKNKKKGKVGSKQSTNRSKATRPVRFPGT